MALKTQKRMSAKLLKVGENRVWFDPDSLADIKEAITKEDIRGLIKDGVIKAKKKKGISKGRFRKRLKQKRKGLKKGAGKRKGKRTTKRRGKKVWIKKVRVLRKLLKEHKKVMAKKDYWQLRKEIKSGGIKYKKHLLERIKEIGKEK
ncbi:50S ribosomal protein L19e [Candidatus Pacearchaeota archaeon ex4484_26]|nr:MAG: 50S ribosomal protein L19e [Candidatus Pacearchaeota archaeon ex4484_26]